MGYPYPKRKKCKWCGKNFVPKPNNVKRQKYCPHPKTCKWEVKAEQDRQWREDNPGYHAKYSKSDRRRRKRERQKRKNRSAS